MKYITQHSWFTPTRLLLKQCNWLSVRQLVCYHTILTIRNAIESQVPNHIYRKISSENNQKTRQSVKFDDKFPGKTDRTQDSFCYRGAQLYNKLPMEIRMMSSKAGFKKKTRQWVQMNIPID